jgi:hypothetical protein
LWGGIWNGSDALSAILTNNFTFSELLIYSTFDPVDQFLNRQISCDLVKDVDLWLEVEQTISDPVINLDIQVL